MVTRQARTAIAACRRGGPRPGSAEEIPVRRQYDADVLAAGGLKRRRPGQREVPKVEAERGLVVEDSEGRFCGAVVGYEKGVVTLEDRHGRRRGFPLTPAAFLLEGKPVTLIPPAPAAPAPGTRPGRMASGAIAAP